MYAIMMTNGRGESAGLSNFAPATVLNVAPAPDFRAVTTPNAVKLSWNAAPGAMYRVYRDGVAIGDVSAGEFEDKNFEFDHPYTYMVRGLAVRGNFFAESENSLTQTVTPAYVFHPEPP